MSYKLEILPEYGFFDINWRELIESKELLLFLAYKDIKVKYKQTMLGAAWAVLQPMFAMIIFTLLFGKLAKLPSDNIPYPIFVYSALFLWIYFSGALSLSSTSLMDSSQLLSKVYIPRIFIPSVPCLSALVDYVIALFAFGVLVTGYSIMNGDYSIINIIGILTFIILLIIITMYIPRLGLLSGLVESGATLKALFIFSVIYAIIVPFVINFIHIPYITLLFLPHIIITTVLLASGIGYWLSSICVKYRDVRFILPFFIQLLMYASPVVYSINSVTGIFKILLYLNPITGLIANHRACLTGQPIDVFSFVISLILTLVIFITGLLYLKRTEKHFADLV
jgi:lipopolysaccharide transport system permease protein